MDIYLLKHIEWDHYVLEHIKITNLVSFIGHTKPKTILEIVNKYFFKNANLLIMIQTNGKMIWYALTCYQMQYLSTKNEGFETTQPCLWQQ